MKKDDPHRGCENPHCRAIDSTKCAFKPTEFGRVPKKDVDEARRLGCRVVRFQ